MGPSIVVSHPNEKRENLIFYLIFTPSLRYQLASHLIWQGFQATQTLHQTLACVSKILFTNSALPMYCNDPNYSTIAVIFYFWINRSLMLMPVTW